MRRWRKRRPPRPRSPTAADGRAPCVRASSGGGPLRRASSSGARSRDGPEVEHLALDGGAFERRSRSPVSSWSMRAASSARIVGGTVECITSPVRTQEPFARSSAPSSTSMPSISSTKRGLPSAASVIRARTDSSSDAPSRCSIRRSASASPSGSSSTDVALSFPPAQPGRASRSSGRARQTSRIGGLARPVGDVLDQVEERWLGPVDVVEDDDEALAVGASASTAGVPPRRSPPVVRAPRRLPSAGWGAPVESLERPRASSSSSSSPRPGSSRTISPIGQYVIPSPYGRQRPPEDRRGSVDLVQESSIAVTCRRRPCRGS